MLSKLFNKPKQSDDVFIEMSNIVKIFHTPAGEFPALKGIDADFHKGEFVSVVGKSGSGKSTLVNMLAGIDHPTSGEVRIGDTYVHKLNESQMSRWRGRNLGIVFQFYQLLPMLSLLENVMLPMDFGGMYAPAERETRAMNLLDMVGLADVAHKMPAAVSGGQQQSAAIARALANDPPLIVADEPTGNLDSRAADVIFRIFEELSTQGKTIIMVTHDSSLADRASRKVLLADGEMINETVAKTLPLLTHRQMLKATKILEPRRFEAGETIIQQGNQNNRFYMIAQGHTEVHLEQKARSGVVARLGPGQYFGEVELFQRRDQAVASVKAAVHSAVEVLTLEKHAFVELMNEANAMRDALVQVVQERLAQNALFERGGIGYAQTSLA
ncbi:MAG: ATP-binding cassette domain-containing protein [Anaerolineae bacterium]|nr:ATP-binding cassette domain-containing protein [Anaerolineae bacterium]